MGSKITFGEEATQANKLQVIQLLIRMGYGLFSPDNKIFHVTGGATNGNLREEEKKGIRGAQNVASVD